MPLTGPRNGWVRLPSCLTIQDDFTTNINNSFYWFKSDSRRTLQSQTHAPLHNPSFIGSDTCIVTSIFIYSAINGQGAIAKLLDSMANFNIHPLSAPLDGWGRVSFHLTIQDCVTSKWFNPVRRVITFEDWRFFHMNESNCLHKTNTVLCSAHIGTRILLGHSFNNKFTVSI